MSKRFIVIGLGNFGNFVARRLFDLGHEVVAIDSRAEVVDAIGPFVSRATVGDATKRAVLEEVGARKGASAVVSTGENLAASILSLMALRDIGVEEIFVKVRSKDHERIVNALGATEGIFPERESADNLAARVTSGAGKLQKFVKWSEELVLQEMGVPSTWRGKSLRELELPAKEQVQVVAVHSYLTDSYAPVPGANRILTESDTLVVAGSPDALERLAELK